VYQPGSALPSGAPGDPSRDYSRSRACGAFESGVWLVVVHSSGPGGAHSSMAVVQTTHTVEGMPCSHLRLCKQQSEGHFTDAHPDVDTGIPVTDHAFSVMTVRVHASGADMPYRMCPAPGGLPADPLARDCCRHMAYCVPRWGG
jgi:hypothetical protein